MVALAHHLLRHLHCRRRYFYLDSGAVRGVTVVGQSPGIEGVKACVACRAWSLVPVRGRLASRLHPCISLPSWPLRLSTSSSQPLDVCCWRSRRMACPWLVASTRGLSTLPLSRNGWPWDVTRGGLFEGPVRSHRAHAVLGGPFVRHRCSGCRGRRAFNLSCSVTL